MGGPALVSSCAAGAPLLKAATAWSTFVKAADADLRRVGRHAGAVDPLLDLSACI